MPESGGRPRTAVLAECWSGAGVDAPALCNKAGQPVARAVKCLIDPLVVRPRLRPHLAAPLLDAAAAGELTELLAGARDRLGHASEWFLLLRSARRRRRITDGNAQELYFPRAYELAVEFGSPADAEAAGRDPGAECDRVLSEVHPDEVTVADLAAHLADPALAREYGERIAASWVPEGECSEVDAAWLAGVLWQVLDDDGEAADEPAPGPEEGYYTWDDLVESGECGALGTSIRYRSGVVGTLLEEFESPDTGVRVTGADPAAPPPLEGDEGRVLDRSLASRCRSALRRARESTWVADPAELADAEMGRIVEPFGLRDGAAQAMFAAGVVTAAGLFPLNPDLPEGPLLIRELQARLRKEAYVMHLRRQLARGGAIDARQERVVGQLAEFWDPYLRRLWPRLHGLDVVGRVPGGADDMRELLSGVTRSVVYDHRQLIRAALEAAA